MGSSGVFAHKLNEIIIIFVIKTKQKKVSECH